MVLQHASSILQVLRGYPGQATDFRWVSWRAPPDGWCALYVDGSSLGNPGRAGAGGVVRDSTSRWCFHCFGFSAFVGFPEILKAGTLGDSPWPATLFGSCC